MLARLEHSEIDSSFSIYGGMVPSSQRLQGSNSLLKMVLLAYNLHTSYTFSSLDYLQYLMVHSWLRR